MRMGLSLEFDAAHRLPGYDGKCSRVHGHTYDVEVVLEGPVDDENGFLVDFYDLKQILKSVLEELDHRDLNEILSNPTAERIAEHIKASLESQLLDRSASLVSVKLWEGKNKWVMTE
ncbi:MAG: 6-carboxytetrahydropterin synthase QueD [Methanothrix sp.]|jgi:queuosine biosynthesis protein QueD|uniref:Queuosine biosynthesis protein QueD n=1 Tax=Methanothrix harundinacea TaxID=301375 RepID=A0A101FUY1_9EURY|nr:MAG: Queuosine biosynthesis protein QueD [Methanothrix harundinacea]KUK95180.1 MAG: Queuosine biosynthesis protein QueD [Methanothrix harundinacea]MDD2639162.1 6-carboxytetrahydropterin synthase QueD [Methanothrix sp.]MDD5768941.1 6-carboxytetrahydropterin synthase QueD [Methanothrix sp.]MDI9399996.1 6-carboxytetrahydropterin synthase QueD [Euryarchaeota archaeon]